MMFDLRVGFANSYGHGLERHYVVLRLRIGEFTSIFIKMPERCTSDFIEIFSNFIDLTIKVSEIGVNQDSGHHRSYHITL
jgi:hypothetical protein